MNCLVVKRGKRRRQWHPTPVLLPGKSHRRRSLEGCSPWGRWGSDTTEWLHVHFSLSCIGEGNGNPLQCSCLENPRVAVYGVAQGRTRLKWLSSSRVGNGNPFQYSCQGNPMDKGAWQATIQSITKSQTWLSNWAHSVHILYMCNLCNIVHQLYFNK